MSSVLTFELLTRECDRAGLVFIDYAPERPTKPVILRREPDGMAIYYAGQRFLMPGLHEALDQHRPRSLIFAEVDEQLNPRRTYQVELP